MARRVSAPVEVATAGDRTTEATPLASVRADEALKAARLASELNLTTWPAIAAPALFLTVTVIVAGAPAVTVVDDSARVSTAESVTAPPPPPGVVPVLPLPINDSPAEPPPPPQALKLNAAIKPAAIIACLPVTRFMRVNCFIALTPAGCFNAPSDVR